MHEPVFGPLVMLGLGGTAADVLGGYAARLAPMTGADADDLIAESRAAPLLRDPAGARPPHRPAADTAALAGLLLRVSRLADDLPEVAELELSPLIAGREGVSGGRHPGPAQPGRQADPFLRLLR